MRSTVLICCLFFSAFVFAQQQVIELRQSDFDHGTYILSEPGYYRLMENIVFNPNNVADIGPTSYESGDVQTSQYTFMGGKYDPAAYGIGFFAAIAISAQDATLDLNGFKLSQSPEHALQQRFYANIELADQPFLPNQGPHDFGDSIVSATRVVIKNGVIGLSSHHGIHGNKIKDVTIQDIHFVDYEVAAIAVNGADGLTIKRVICEGSRTDIPVYGTFSVARFLRPYVNYLHDNNYDGTIRIGGVQMDINDIYTDLRTSLNNAYNDIIASRNGARGGSINKNTHPDEYALFHNADGTLDGNTYGILLNKPGVAVNGFPTIPTDPFTNVHISDVEVHNTIGNIQEVIVLEAANGDGLIDSVGAALQFFNKHPDTHQYISITSDDFSQCEYTGNPVTNAQLFVGKAILAGAFASSSLSTRRSGTNQDLLDWVEATPGTSAAKFQNYVDKYGIFCNGDTMFHANKGVIGLKLDASQNVVVENTLVSNVVNNGKLGSTLCGYDTAQKSNPHSELTGYQGAATRGVSICGSVGIDLIDVTIEDVFSASGTAVGIDSMLDSHDVNIIDCSITGVHASTDHNSLNDYTGPNAYPEARGVRAGTSTARVVIDSLDGSDNSFTNANNGNIIFIQNDSMGGNTIYSSMSSNDDDDNNSFSFSSDSSSSANILAPVFAFIFAFVLLF